jgi:hypothetical protein
VLDSLEGVRKRADLGLGELKQLSTAELRRLAAAPTKTAVRALEDVAGDLNVNEGGETTRLLDYLLGS